MNFKRFALQLCVLFFFCFSGCAPQANADGREKKKKALAHYTMGIIYDNRQKPALAAREYEKSLKYVSRSAPAHLRLGADYLVLGDEEKALREFEAAKEIDPENKETRILLALVYANRGIRHTRDKKFDEALRNMEKATELYPESAQLYFYTGVIYEQTGKKVRAAENFRKAIEFDPTLAEAYNYLGYMFAEDGENLDEAVELVQKALQLDPGNPAYIDSLGWTYFKSGKISEAIKELERAVSSDKEDAVMRGHLGDVYFEKGLFDKAKTQWEKSLELNPKQEKVKEKIRKLGDPKNAKTPGH